MGLNLSPEFLKYLRFKLIIKAQLKLDFLQFKYKESAF